MVVSPFCSGTFKNVDTLEFLLTHVDASLPDNSGRTALSYALAQDDDTMSSVILNRAGSASRMKKLRNEAKNALVSLPSTVVNSCDVFENDHDFYDDYELFMDSVQKDDEVEIKNLSYKEAVERGLKPKPDERVEGELVVVEDEEGRALNVVLVKVNISYSYFSMNLFYKMQLLYETNRKLFILFTNWGRVGTTGQFQQTPFFSKEDAVKEFAKIFKEKTRNEWTNVDSFEKKYRKYNLVSLTNRRKFKQILKPFEFDNPATAKSKIPEIFQDLMRSLTNNKMYQMAYDSFEISKDYLPFGYLNRDTLIEAKNLLKEIRSLLRKQQINTRTIEMNKRIELAEEINTKTSLFYELIPSSKFQEAAIPSFHLSTVNSAELLIQNLLDFEVVSKMLCAAQFRQRSVHPFDYCLRSLGVRIAHVDLRSEEARILLKYISNSTKLNQGKIVENIFAISRPQEEAEFLEMDNRRLLWHGTKTENLVSILHNGLKIAPPSAEHTGSMFGNGIYFADFFDKSLNYCANHYINLSNRSVFILLCEVSLGKMKKLYQAKEIKKLTGGFNSVKGSGRFSHKKNQNLILNNGCLVPLGELKDKNLKNQAAQNQMMGSATMKIPKKRRRAKVPHWNKMGKKIIGLPGKAKKAKKKYYSLNYNEFVVYNTNQVKIRYLIEINKNIVPQ